MVRRVQLGCRVWGLGFIGSGVMAYGLATTGVPLGTLGGIHGYTVIMRLKNQGLASLGFWAYCNFWWWGYLERLYGYDGNKYIRWTLHPVLVARRESKDCSESSYIPIIPLL